MTYYLILDEIYVWFIGGCLTIFILVSYANPAIFDQRNGLAFMSVISAFDFVTDVNLLLISEWYNKSYFGISMAILLFQFLPYILYTPIPITNYTPMYIFILENTSTSIQCLNRRYLSITANRWKNSDTSTQYNGYVMIFCRILWFVSFAITAIIDLLIIMVLIILALTVLSISFLTILLVTLIFFMHLFMILFAGYFLYSIKLLPQRGILYNKLWWSSSSKRPIIYSSFIARGYYNINELWASDDKYELTLQLILFSECIFRTIPQFILQIVNSMQLDHFSTMTEISIGISSVLLIISFYIYSKHLCFDRYCGSNTSEKTFLNQLLGIAHWFKSSNREYGIAIKPIRIKSVAIKRNNDNSTHDVSRIQMVPLQIAKPSLNYEICPTATPTSGENLYGPTIIPTITPVVGNNGGQETTAMQMTPIISESANGIETEMAANSVDCNEDISLELAMRTKANDDNVASDSEPIPIEHHEQELKESKLMETISTEL